ncbi:MAG: DNA-directed RNA polymerase subunit D [Thermosphaera sp.]
MLALKIEVLEQKPLLIRLKISGISLPLLNSVRRVIIAEVPTMAIDYVAFMENSSVFYDEYVAHRLGLIPLTSDEALEKYKNPEECREAGEKGLFSEDCFVRLSLEGEGGDQVVTLYSESLVSSDPDVKPVFEKIPIVKLIKSQKVKLEAYARLGRGREHIKWSPVSVAAHKYVPKILLNPKLCKSQDCLKCIEVCPKEVFEFREGEVRAKKEKVLDCTMCKLCENACPTGAVKIAHEEDEYVLTLELTGALSAKNVLLESVKILEKKLDDFVSALKEKGV